MSAGSLSTFSGYGDPLLVGEGGGAGVRLTHVHQPTTAPESEEMGVIMLADPTQMRRLVEFASDITRLADERRDTELRVPSMTCTPT
jgi:hypothetical protein